MRVLMTADTIGGVWTFAIDLCRALESHGVEVMLATMGRAPSPRQRQQAHSCSNLRLHESCYALEWMDNPWDDIRDASRWLLKLRDEFGPDVIHLNGYCHASLDWQRPVLVAAHSCVLSWWEAARGEPAPAPWDTYRRRVAEGVRAADMVVAPTAAMLDAIHRHYGTTRSSRVICNGRDASMYAPAVKRKVVLSDGRLWDEARNLATLERAAEMIRWPVEVAGSVDHPDGRRVASSLVHLLGELEDEQLAKAYACASVYALPTKYEPFGLSVLEAALSGCALVLGDIPSLRETWGEAATYVSPDDPNGLADAINGLIQDNARRAGMALMAWRRALAYSPRRMANGYVEAYRELLGGRWRLPRSEAKMHITMHA